MAWRIALLGTIFLGLLVVLLLQMWQMQVTNVAAFEERAANNLVRFVELPAPRGDIRDANGALLAGSGTALTAVLEGGLLPEDDPALVQRIATFAQMPVVEVQDLVDKARRRGDRLTLIEQLTTEQARSVSTRTAIFFPTSSATSAAPTTRIWRTRTSGAPTSWARPVWSVNMTMCCVASAGR
jgi:cell division protein FtsI/penicillin-binding protein 2